MPAPIQIFITIESEDWENTLDQVKEKLENLEEYVLMLGDVVTGQFTYNFSSNDWPALALATVIRKQQGGFPMDMLVRTEELKGAATGGEWEASGDASGATARLGLPDYAAFHMEGTKWMPARDFTFLPDSFTGQAEEVFFEYLDV